jgi:transposase
MKKQHIELKEEELKHLEELLSKGSLKARTYQRALALLEWHRGKTITEVAQLLGVSYPTAHSWVKKYHQEGLAFLQDKARPGRPPVYDGVAQARVTALACSEAPEGYSQWSLRLLADQAVELGLVESISHTDVRRILKKTNTNLTSNANGASGS